MLQGSTLFVASFLCVGAASSASTITVYQVTVDTSSISGTAGSFDFNFNPGPLVTQSASLQVLTFATNGTLSGGPMLTGNVAGTLPATVTFDNGTGFNDYFQGFTLGSILMFQVGLYGPAVSSPDGVSTSGSAFAFSMFSNAAGTTPVLTTDTTHGFAFTVNVNLDGTATVTNSAGSYVTVQVNLVVQTPQTITFGPLNNIGFSAAPITLTATASSGLTLSFTSTTPSVCTISGSTLTLVAVGACSITASQAGNASYAAAPSVVQSFMVNPRPQTITFGPLSNQPLGTGPFPVSATASSGLVVTFVSNTPSICTVSGLNVALVATGTCSITASQPGNATYAAATSVIQNFTVTIGSQTISFDAIPNQVVGVPPFQIAVQASSGLPVGTVSDTLAVCKVASGLVMLLSAGTCSLTASQGGNASFSAATPVTRNFTASLAKPSGTLVAAAGSPFTVGTDPDYLVVGDFNGDGIPDLATANFDNSNVTVLLGDGSGGFMAAPGSPFAVGSGPYSMVEGDFNGDGIQDLATVNLNVNTVSVLFGNGSGGFAPAPGSPFTVALIPQSDPQIMVVGDFNGDGIQDLAITDSGGNYVTLWLGNGSGGFTSAGATASPPAEIPGSLFNVVVGDFNGDGIQDLATIYAGYTTNDAFILLGNGSGGFTATPGSPYKVGNSGGGFLVGDFNGDGHLDLVAGTAVLLGNGSGGFTTAPGSPDLSKFGVSVVGDFNGDGIQDLIGSDVANTLTVLLGNGAGGFTAVSGRPFTVGTAPDGFAVGDFNRDGKLDVAVANANIDGIGTPLGAGNVTVLLGASASTSSVLSTTSLLTITNGTAVPLTLTVSDTVTAFSGPSGTVTFLDGASVLGSAAQAPWTFTASSLALGSHTLTAAYGGDTRSRSSSSNSITIQVDPGGGTSAQTITFGPLSNQALGSSAPSLSATASSGLAVMFSSNTASVCTVSGANLTLLAVGTCSITANQIGNTVYAAAAPVTRTFTVIGSQTITFAAIPNQILGVSPFQIAAQASSGLAVGIASTTPAVCKSSSGLVMLLGAGTCSITASQGGSAVYGAAPSVTRSFNVNQAKPTGTLMAAAGSPFSAGSNPGSIVVGDFNGDGIQDLATANSNNVTVLLGNGSGGFTAAAGSPFAAGVSPGTIVVGDFNGDGIQDLAVANPYTSSVTMLLGNGSGGFTAAPGIPLAVESGPDFMVVGDFNGDGKLDLATITLDNSFNPTITVLLGNGSGGFTAVPGSPYVSGGSLGSVVVGDFNGDGIQDLAVANAFSNSVTVLLGDGSGGFTAAPGSPFAVGNTPISMAVGDFKGDGAQGLAVANDWGSNVTVLLGNGSGGFTAAPGSPFAVGASPISVAAGDFNGDGIVDLAVTNGGDNTVTVLLGNGSGGFTAARSPFPVGTNPNSVVVGGFNGDGKLDVATANNNNVTVLLGESATTRSVLSTTSPLTITVGQSVPLTLTVSDTTTAFSVPTGTATFLDGAMVLGAASQSGSPYTFSAAILGAGSHTLTATYSGDTRSAGSSSNSVTITVLAISQTITFGVLSNVTFGAPPFTVSASASSGLPVSFNSQTSSVCTVSGATVKLVSVGTCTIQATQGGNTSYAAAPSVIQSFQVQAPTALGLRFYPLTPCRVADTRTFAGFTGAQGPPYMAGKTSRNFPVAGLCGVPANATAYSLNMTVVPLTDYLGFLTTWPAGQPQPVASTLNSWEGLVVANAALVPAGTNGEISMYVSDDTDVLFDINGYFAPPATSGLQFYPLTPCRVADTRSFAGFTGAQGPPYMQGKTSRNFPVSGLCGVPASATAYSFNVTAVPRTDYLGFLTTWPSGQAQPVASTLNSWTGTVVANAAIVPAGTGGAIGIYVSDDTDVLFDINGYFAPPATSGLDYFTVTPCRVADTRAFAGMTGPFGPPSMAGQTSRSFPVRSSACAVPAAAAAYSLNVTVVPETDYLGFLATWGTGQPQPVASTLNSWDGQVRANAALVPAGTNGAISIYVSDPTDVLFDISGYFGPGQ